jgi:hypothetical protein
VNICFWLLPCLRSRKPRDAAGRTARAHAVRLYRTRFSSVRR